jgi:monothiol glutaredoxin
MTSAAMMEKIKSDVTTHPVILFMKGTAEQPMCGFSAQVVQILKSYGVQFEHRNVLADDELREGIKQFTNWPTIPQLYVKGKFIGGCDIVTDMHRKGQLKDLFASA